MSLGQWLPYSERPLASTVRAKNAQVHSLLGAVTRRSGTGGGGAGQALWRDSPLSPVALSVQHQWRCGLYLISCHVRTERSQLPSRHRSNARRGPGRPVVWLLFAAEALPRKRARGGKRSSGRDGTGEAGIGQRVSRCSPKNRGATLLKKESCIACVGHVRCAWGGSFLVWCTRTKQPPERKRALTRCACFGDSSWPSALDAALFAPTSWCSAAACPAHRLTARHAAPAAPGIFGMLAHGAQRSAVRTPCHLSMSSYLPSRPMLYQLPAPLSQLTQT